MVSKADVNEFLGKKKKIILNNGYMYRGVILEVTDSMLVIEDIKIGKVKIALHAVMTIQDAW
jgi:hypothetical protein